MKKSKVIIIGDLIIDRYIHGTVERISPEAPVPIIKQTEIIEKLGGAGLVYDNLLSLGVDVDLFPINDRSVKTRVFVGNQYITRIDEDCKSDGEKILRSIKTVDFSKIDYVVLSDYNKGVLDCVQEIIKYINTFGCKIIVDPKRHSSFYKDVWLVKPNYKEFYDFEFEKWNSNIIITNADKPVTAFIDGQSYISHVEKTEVVDVTGAGDCFLAAFIYGLTKKYDYQKCLDLANRASNVSIRYPGTYIIKEEDLKSKVVFTNGCFDVIHRGHIDYLNKSRKLGDKLIVAINSDESVRRLKGDLRPINNQNDRKIVLESLKCVDEVIVFEEDTPYELIKKIKPDIITKGGDYTKDNVIGNDISEVVIIPLIENLSTTNILNKI